MLKQFGQDWQMTLAAFIIAFTFYFTKKKKYSVTWTELIIISILLAFGGTIGNSIGSLITGTPAGGRRAYGMVLCNAFTVMTYTTLVKSRDGRLTDYAAIPAAAICCVGKAECIFEGCCYGIDLFQTTAGNTIQFPSQIFEELCLIGIVIFLMILEKKGTAYGFLWPLYVTWYGITRYIGDLFRGVPSEREPFFLGLPAGQLWSIVVIIVGLFELSLMFKRKYSRNPEGKELLRAIIGKYPSA